MRQQGIIFLIATEESYQEKIHCYNEKKICNFFQQYSKKQKSLNSVFKTKKIIPSPIQQGRKQIQLNAEIYSRGTGPDQIWNLLFCSIF
jgi:hypothetical protein